MAAVSLVPADLAPFAEIPEAKALEMIEDVMARAARVAPCILTADFEYAAAAKAVLRGVILRWHEAGTGALTSESLGEYSYTQDNRQARKTLFWPSEVEELQELCQGEEGGGAFAIDSASTMTALTHADICALNFGATYCSCGAVLTQYQPLYEITYP